tara:strand:+ start:348 stop:695 length:348 start_codon:yes stop_codon:yes gene_type:complete
MSSGPEQREHPRIPLQLLVQFRLKDMETFLKDYALNISSGGLFIKSLDPHPLGSMIYLQIQLEDGEKLIEGLGKVVHVNHPSQENPGMGIEFINIDQNSRDVIDHIIAERLSKYS